MRTHLFQEITGIKVLGIYREIRKRGSSDVFHTLYVSKITKNIKYMIKIILVKKDATYMNTTVNIFY